MNFSEKANKLIKKATNGREHIKFTVGVLHEGKTIFKLYDSRGEIPYVSHLYETASVGKVFVTSLLAKYLAAGKMSLDDSVAKYIPELDDDRYYPTLKRLATHTAGYSPLLPINKREIFSIAAKKIGASIKKKKYSAENYLKMDFEKMIRLAKEGELQDKDYKWSYSNYGISLLGYAISNVAGKDFWELMNDYLAQDLGLKNSFLGTNHSGILNGYDLKNRNIGNWSLGREDYLTPSGNIASNAEDLLEFARMNICENPNYLGLCHTRYDMQSKHRDMGLGWWIDYENPSIFYHGGNIEGFASMLAFDKKKKTSVVILANISYYKERKKLFLDILDNL